MESVLRVAIPALTFALMLLVGLALTPQDFRAALRRRRALGIALVLPWIVSPLAAWGVTRLLPGPDANLILIAACPSGSMAGIYVFLAGVKPAAALSWIGCSCLAAVLFTPGALWAVSGGATIVAVPARPLLLFLALLLALPVTLGLLARRRWADAVAAREKLFRGLGAAGLAAIVGLSILAGPGAFVGSFRSALPIALYTAGCAAAGEGVARLAGLEPAERLGMTLLIPIRNLPIATSIAVFVLGRPDFAPFAASFFAVQTFLLLGVVLLYRRILKPAGGIA